MSYRVEIVCDDKRATVHDPMGACHSLQGHRSATEVPSAEAHRLNDAKNAAALKATALGWRQMRRAGMPHKMTCPACLDKIERLTGVKQTSS